MARAGGYLTIKNAISKMLIRKLMLSGRERIQNFLDAQGLDDFRLSGVQIRGNVRKKVPQLSFSLKDTSYAIYLGFVYKLGGITITLNLRYQRGLGWAIERYSVVDESN